MIKLHINLRNSNDGVLGTRVVIVNEGEDTEALLRQHMIEAVSDWVLAPGDVIKIEEV